MINVSPGGRIVAGLLLALPGLLVLGAMVGWIPDKSREVDQARRTLTDSLAFQYAYAAKDGDLAGIDRNMRLLIKQNPQILLITLSPTDGEPAAQAGKQRMPRIRRPPWQPTGSELRAPVYVDRHLWGSLSVRFSPFGGPVLAGFRQHPLAGVLTLLAVFPLAGFLLLSGLRFQHIAPPTSVPGQVRAALDALAEGVLLLDMHGRILLANTAFANGVDKKPGALVGRRVADLKWEFGRTYEDELPWDTAQRLGEVQTGRQLRFRCPSGITRTFMVNAAPVRDGDHSRGVMVTFDDLTQLEEKNDQLEEMLGMLRKSRAEIRRQNRELQILATRDPLTNCLNRRSFFEKCETLFAAARRNGQRLACIMVDIDLFKSINDRYGHVKGDEVLSSVAQTLQASLRTTDTICRYGGEEFCIVLPGADLEQAITTAMRARANIASVRLAGPGEDSACAITASFGLAAIDPEVVDFTQFIDRADQALYIAKNSGRNRVSVWDAQAGGGREAAHRTLVTSAGSGAAAQELIPDTTLPESRRENREATVPVLMPGYDSLTGLPGRTLFHNRVIRAIGLCRDQQQYFSLVILDVHMFSDIDRTLGFACDDALLKELSRRLAHSVRSTDSVIRFADDEPETSTYRLGGDAFGILLTGTEHAEFTIEIVRRIIDALTQTVDIGGHKITPACSIGITLYPEHGRDADSLLKNAGIALYYAKCRGWNSYQLYSEELILTPTGNFNLEGDLRRAIENGQLELHYQPRIDLESGRILCMEALLRWRHPQLGMIPPVQLLSLAERTGLISSIGRWVLRTACRQLGAWHQDGHADLAVAVNLSAVQFHQKDLLLQVSSTLDETGIAPRYLELEIIEATIMDDMEAASATLRRLHKAGIKISVDQFGTGYSSLNHLKRFPISAVNIDRSFIRDITTDPDDAGIIKAIIAMAHGLGLRVIAEGVETEAQRAFLRDLRCDEFQGFLFSPPVSHDEAAILLGENGAGNGKARLAS
jgi:diguanylate cyclase (GGDEF)-like protein/PAS domain S-box-containing protein